MLQLADKSEPELRKSVSELIKKCDELLRHKRFLANQAAESTHLAQLGRKRRRSPAGQDGDPDHLRDGDGDQAGGEGDDETDDLLECAVCRSAMSDELQVGWILNAVVLHDRRCTAVVHAPLVSSFHLLLLLSSVAGVLLWPLLL